MEAETPVYIDPLQEELYLSSRSGRRASFRSTFMGLLYSQAEALPKEDEPPSKLVGPLRHRIKAKDEADPFRFVATLQKGSYSGFNLGVGTCNSGELIIMGVKDGPGVKWNEEFPALDLRPFDCIVEVNGISNDPQALIEELGSADVAHLLIRRPQEFTVSLNKPRESKRMLGLGLSSLDNGTSLTVHEISEGGLVQEWNRENTSLEVMRGHRVVQVNEVSGDSRAMLELIAKAEKLDLVLQRH